MRGLTKLRDTRRVATRGRLQLAVVLAAGLALSGCVAYPAPYGGYYAAPAVYAPPVVVGVGGGWGWRGGWGWGGRGCCWR